MKGKIDDRKRLCTLWNKGFEFKNTRNRITLICIWKNKFADAEVDYATCVDKQGKRYNIELDNIRGFEDDFEK
ncbi:MAG: hypothetical protein DKM23_05540 [Candidatus Melainabacteria bacterium]|nr:MAG: hypothetical protein DKM23_05540 [Candidatus Melainabacteria bacterium]